MSINIAIVETQWLHNMTQAGCYTAGFRLNNKKCLVTIFLSLLFDLEVSPFVSDHNADFKTLMEYQTVLLKFSLFI